MKQLCLCGTVWDGGREWPQGMNTGNEGCLTQGSDQGKSVETYKSCSVMGGLTGENGTVRCKEK